MTQATSRIALLTLVSLTAVTFRMPLPGGERQNSGKGTAPTAEAERHFVRHVLPVLKDKCLACHGDDPKKQKGGLDLRTRAAMLTGGDSGEPALVPGRPEKSPLFIAVTRKDDTLKMPPKENDKLSTDEVERFRGWIAAGAPWPEAARIAALQKDDAAGVTVATSGGLSPDWTNRRYQPEDLWAYQPVRRPAVPTDVLDPARVRNPIDAFIQAKLKAKGVMTLAPEADQATFVRRATFDLTGLPPDVDVGRIFNPSGQTGRIENPSYEELVDRLLASPHYGEQQARHWLDVVRYADTSGFSNDYERPNAWRYRDYVVRRFNADVPYDRFVTEQLAGDELDPTDPEMLIAAGFLRMGPWEHTGMTVAAVTRQQFLDDVTHHVGVTLLGQGLRCAACHDHKFDPVPTRDYYRVQAVFAATQFAEREAAFLPSENVSSFGTTKAVIERRLQETRDVLAGIARKNQEAVAAYVKERGVASFADLPASERSRRDNLGLSKQDLSIRKVYQKRRDYFERELLRFEPYTFSAYSGPPNNYTSNRVQLGLPAKRPGTVPAVHILTGGGLESPGEPVTPGVLSAMASFTHMKSSEVAAIPEAVEGRRTALARWVVSPDNTLTARVLVNRVWQQHFGTGLVATPNNFGKMGAKLTHPELLDWLAAWFMDNGWSLKKLHRLVMTSATYRQAGSHPEMERLRTLDAKNELLAYFPPRRLAAEEIRDAMLAVTGELNRAAGGPGVFPEINWEVAVQPRHIMGSVAPAYQPSPTPAERHRRTLYAFRIRTLADPLLEVFNRPGSETSCERRDETTVTPQVFALFHSEFVHNRALAFAAALEKQAATSAGRIQLAFRACYGRPPPTAELKTCEEHVTRMTAYHREHPPRPTELPTKVKRHMVEEMTGEDVTWEEELDVMKHYQRDLMPWQVSPETRGLAEVCLVLLNSNEFLYLR